MNIDFGASGVKPDGQNGRVASPKTGLDSNIEPPRPVGKTTRDTAILMISFGLWPVPLFPRGVRRPNRESLTEGKEPFGTKWGLKRNTVRDINSKFNSIKEQYKDSDGAGIGVALGPYRAPDGGWLIDVEGDGPEAEESRLKLFGGQIIETMGWSSARGGHQLMTANVARLAELLPGIAGLEAKGTSSPGVYHLPTLPGLEIRIGGFMPNGVVKQIQSVFPPTLATDGKPREWNGVSEIAEAPESLYEALVSSGRKPEPTPEPAIKLFTVPDVPAKNGKTKGGRPDPETRAAKYLAACPPAISGEEGHNRTFGVACRVGPGFDLTEETALRLIKEHYNPRCKPPWSDKDLQHKVADAYRLTADRGFLRDAEPKGSKTNGSPQANGKHAKTLDNVQGSVNGQAEQPPVRPPIFVTTEEHEVNDQAVAALAADQSIYSRGFKLTVVRRSKGTTKGVIRAAGCPQIAHLPLPGLRERLARYAAWMKWRKLRDGELEAVPTHPPDWAVSAVDARGEWPSVRPLEFVIEAPVLRLDGTILDTPGYDEETGLLFEPNAAFLPIKNRPTLADAKAAADRVLDLVTDFPFANLMHAAAWLAALLTPLSRFAIAGPCPLFLFDATAAGSGKSMLTDMISFITSGREMARKDYPDNNEEMRKVITAVALAGDPMVLLDNIAVAFGCSALDAALTGRTWKDRILGRSQMTPELPLFTVWFASGNNVGLRGDVMRRIIPCRLEPQVERPEERTDFKYPKLMRHVRENRPQLVADVLTILRAYFAAGRPDQKLTPLGSYDEWSDVVRSAVVWTIGADPCEAREDLRAADDTAGNTAAVVHGWNELPNSKQGMTAAQALKIVKENPASYSTLRDAFMSWSRNDELPSQRVVGNRLKPMRGKVVEGQFLHSEQDRTGTQLWSIRVIRS